MFAITGGWDEFWILVGSAVVGAIAVGIGTSVVHLFRNRSTTAKDDEEDMSTLTDFFFDKPRNPRTRTPATKGWTTKVDDLLTEHGERLDAIHTSVQRILAEVTPDGNGGHNLRGAVVRSAEAASKAAENAEKAVQAAETEAQLQVEERQRVAQREQEADK